MRCAPNRPLHCSPGVLAMIPGRCVGHATPAFSQTTTVTEYYVVQDTGTKKCTIVEKKPTEATILPILQVGPAFKTRIEAESGMKTIKVCTTN